MIAFLRGELAGSSASTAYIDVGGVGYAVLMAQRSLALLPAVGETVAVFTHMQVSDAGIALYGFASEEERAVFNQLITVNGVGPKMALAALSTFTPKELASAIAAENIAAVSKIPGVGKKTASRIVLELKGSQALAQSGLFDAAEGVPVASVSVGAAAEAAAEALLSMGFTEAEAALALKDAPEGAVEAELLQYALKRLGTKQ